MDKEQKNLEVEVSPTSQELRTSSNDAEEERKNVTKTSEEKETSEASKPDEDEENDSPQISMMQLLLKRLGITGPEEEIPKPPNVLDDFSLAGVADYIKTKDCKNIIVMTGAGISTSAGIPDFRSPGSGLYHNLEKYNLPSPQSIFELGYFATNPDPFFMLAKELYPGKFKPTVSHLFQRILAEKGMMLRIYTQNIDGLEIVAGIDPDLVVAAHGTFHSAHCTACQKEYSEEWEKERIFADKIPKCEDCDAVVKPDIVFFGESLPQRFLSLVTIDFSKCDLLIVMGTSLVVQPFASLIDRVPENTPRLLINNEKCGEQTWFGGFDFDSERKYRDVAHLTTCDEGCLELADLLGWKDELLKLVKSEGAKIPKTETNAQAKSNPIKSITQISSPVKLKDQKSSPVKPGSQKSTPVKATSSNKSNLAKPSSQTSSSVKQSSQKSSPVKPSSQKTSVVKPSSQTSSPVKPSSQKSSPVRPSSQTSSPVKPSSQTSSPVKPSSQTSSPVKPSSQKTSPVKPSSQTSSPVKPSSQTSSPVKPSSQKTSPIKPSSQKPSPVKPKTTNSSPVKSSSKNEDTSIKGAAGSSNIR